MSDRIKSLTEEQVKALKLFAESDVMFDKMVNIVADLNDKVPQQVKINATPIWQEVSEISEQGAANKSYKVSKPK